jgi:hypothetical protein
VVRSLGSPFFETPAAYICGMTNRDAFHIRRRWLPRFGLRTLLIALTGTCMLLGTAVGWYHGQEAEYRCQDQLGNKFLDLGAFVSWTSEPPKLLRKWLTGQQAFQRIWRITLYSSDPETIQATIDLVPSLPNLKYLYVINYRDKPLAIENQLQALSKKYPQLRVNVPFSTIDD